MADDAAAAAAAPALPLPPIAAAAGEEEEEETLLLLTIAVAGHPWRLSELSDPALAHHSYAAVRGRVETGVVRVRSAPLTTGYALLLPLSSTRGGASNSVAAADAAADEQGEGGEQACASAHLLASPAHLREHLAHVGYLMRSKPTAELRLVPFAPAWIRDPRARTIDAIVFDPARPPGRAFWEDEQEEDGGADEEEDQDNPGNGSQNRGRRRRRRRVGTTRLIWNNWPGFRAARLLLLPSPPPSNAAAAAAAAAAGAGAGVGWAPIHQHILEVLFSGVEADAEWFLDYLGAIVQRPWVKTGVVVVFTGAQGAGKNTVLDFFRERILGEAIAIQIQQPRQGLLDQFGALHLHRILVQIDEADRLGPMEAALKHLVTADTVPAQQKFKDRVLVQNYLNFIMTTNGACPVHIDSTDRRFCLFRVSDRRVGDHAYFERLHATLDDPRVARSFYNHLLLERPNVLARYGATGNLQRQRPMTPYYQQCRLRSVDPVKLFVSALINEEAYRRAAAPPSLLPSSWPEIKASFLYADYLAHFRAIRAAHSESGLVVRPLSLQAFLAVLRGWGATGGGGVGVVRWFRRGNGTFYAFDYPGLRLLLQRTSEYDPDAFLLHATAIPHHHDLQ